MIGKIRGAPSLLRRSLPPREKWLVAVSDAVPAGAGCRTATQPRRTTSGLLSWVTEPQNVGDRARPLIVSPISLTLDNVLSEHLFIRHTALLRNAPTTSLSEHPGRGSSLLVA